MDPRQHWNQIYRTKGPRVSWFESVPALSLELLDAAGLTPEMCVLDVGGGESTLVDVLLARGLDCVRVLDVSGEAIEHARARLGAAAHIVNWIEADVVGSWDCEPVDIWHDRAVFHFLVSAAERDAYRAHLLSTLKHGGKVIIGTFALDGPDMCSGLPVSRYSAATLARELGDAFTLEDERRHTHVTPSGVSQPFQFARLRRVT